MKRKENQPVEMPARTTRKKGPKDSVYIYLTTRAYRNAAGRPTSDEALIGKLAEDGISLIPNQRYFEFFSDTRDAPASVVALGTSAVLLLLARRLGVSALLHEVFGKRGACALTAAAYMADQGCVMAHIGDWCDESFISGGARLDSKGASDLFESISFDERMRFFSAWIPIVTEDDHIAYDVTSLSTYSGGIEDAEWGLSRDGDDLTQINLGMFLGSKKRLPVYYATYQGSVLDKTHLPVMMGSASALGISRVRFVFDRGFVTSTNLDYVSKKHISFITALPSSLKAFKALPGDKEVSAIHSSRNAIEGGLYAMAFDQTVLGQDLAVHLFYSPAKRALEEDGTYARIERLETELSKLVAAKGLPRKYSDLFTIESTGSTVASFVRDYDRIDARLAACGYFALATNDKTLSSKEVLDAYRGKDVIEKAFSGMKNQLDLKRLRTHSGATTDGKLFCGFIALILHMAIREALAQSTETRDKTVGSALRELKKLKRVTYPDGSVHHTVITKSQRLVLEALDITAEELLAANG
ncbi:MAG: transposase [Coriobacteriia bacterium]|nr:transposase [Coriobacteriia bacterium]